MPQLILEQILLRHLEVIRDVPIVFRNQPTPFVHKAKIKMADGSSVTGYVLGLYKGNIRLGQGNSVEYKPATSVVLLKDGVSAEEIFTEPETLQLDRIVHYEVLESCPKRAAVKLNGEERWEVVRPGIQTSPYDERRLH